MVQDCLHILSTMAGDKTPADVAVLGAAIHEKGTKKLTNQLFAAEKTTKVRYVLLLQYHTWL